MASKPETRYIAKVHRQVDKFSIFHQKMNMMPMCSNGIPDCYYEALGGTELFVEYKYIPKWEGKRKVPINMLSPAQLEWLTRRINNKKACAVVIGAEDGKGIILSGKEIFNPPDITSIKLLTPKQIAEYIHHVTMANNSLHTII